MSGPILLLLLGIILFILGMYLCFTDVGWSGYSAIILGLGIVCITAGAAWGAQQEEDDCQARGGRMVEDGPPYYIKSGDVLVPSQPMKCEMP